jgi:hypothetical protein
MLEHDTAGDPVTGLKWSRRTTEKIAEALRAAGIQVSPSTVSNLLKDMGYSLKVNRKSIAHSTSPERDDQFEYIADMRESFAKAGHPVISVDTKKKEQIGQFKNAGACWEKDARQVNDHDFQSLSKGIAIPYGIYETTTNHASVFVGMSHDTPEFAASSISKWWKARNLGYDNPSKLLILADGGGSNGWRVRAWKAFIQTFLADRFQIPVTVCHYPPGTSKWNPIEHRLFSEITKNWKGVPLSSYETITKYINTTTTATGLKVKATLVKKRYEKGIKITKDDFDQLSIVKHPSLPKWNYTIVPR